MIPFSCRPPRSAASFRVHAGPDDGIAHSISRPLFVLIARTRSSPTNESSSSPPTISIPCDSRTSWKYRPGSAPNVRDNTTSSSITIVHSTPSLVSDAATSLPM